MPVFVTAQAASNMAKGTGRINPLNLPRPLCHIDQGAGKRGRVLGDGTGYVIKMYPAPFFFLFYSAGVAVPPPTQASPAAPKPSITSTVA